MTDLRGHYQRLAPFFTQHWSYSPAYLDWMTDCLARGLQLRLEHTLVDLGCGTGLYAHRLARHARQVLCVDPCLAMIEQLAPDPRLMPVVGTAEQFARQPPYPFTGPFDAILLKEVIHHVDTRPAVVQGLARQLRRRGRLLVVMLPTTIDHPLFKAAHDHFNQATLTPDHVATLMRNAGLDTSLTTEHFPVRLPTQRYLEMVRDRYMSLLSRFTDVELAEGINEIRRQHPGPEIEFVDKFVLIVGRVRRGGPPPAGGP